MKRKKWLSLTLALSVLGSMCAMPMQANAAGETLSAAVLSDVELEEIAAINLFLLGLSDGDEDIDINEDGRINAIDLTLAKQELLREPLPALNFFEADTWNIYLEEEKTVTFTVEPVGIADPIMLYDAEDNALAEMHDDGKNGDAAANDGIYSAQAVLSSDEEQNAGFYAAAGELRSDTYEICFYCDLEEEEYRSFFELTDQFSGMSFEEAAEFISQSSSIVSYTIDEEARQIWYQSIYGIQGCFADPLETEEPTLGSPSKQLVENLGIDYKAARKTIESSTYSLAHPGKQDVIVLSPLRDIDLGGEWLADDVAMTGELLAEALGGKCNWVLNHDVTLEQFENLDSYGAVLYSSHGFTSPDGKPCLPTGVDINAVSSDEDTFIEHMQKYSADFKSGNLIWLNINGRSDNICIMSSFFNVHYNKDDLKDSFWYLCCCLGMHDNSIANTLINKGAGAVVGYTDVITQAYCYRTLFETVINRMIMSGSTVKKGVENAKQVYGEYDPAHSTSQLTFKGQENFRLVDSAASKKYKFKGNKYQVIHSKLTWSQAEAYCESQGGHLATVTSEKEEKFIEKIIKYYNKSDFYWLGATDAKTEGTWEWVTGEEFSYNNWSSTNPNNFNHKQYGYENYLGIVGRNYKYANAFEWNDFADTTKDTYADYNTAFICEYE